MGRDACVGRPALAYNKPNTHQQAAASPANITLAGLHARPHAYTHTHARMYDRTTHILIGNEHYIESASQRTAHDVISRCSHNTRSTSAIAGTAQPHPHHGTMHSLRKLAIIS